MDLEIGLIHILGDCALQQSDFEEALKYYEEAKNNLNSEGSRNKTLVVENLNKIGNFFRYQGVQKKCTAGAPQEVPLGCLFDHNADIG